ncbi:hypothetical protein VSO92_08055 [Myroides pelagicus]|uniref:hypothetical protein n=1 Tax=Myroides pelagicus TaxID=270914 RepID=UPI002DB77C55|nr:hypothetical protein [Myroides pelagicus]MEC4114057.1 hypothetical protein [Myroides pelagicus]
MKKRQEATEQQLKQITEIQDAVRELPEEYFKYDLEHKRFSLKRQISFLSMSSEIMDEDKLYLIKVGKSISELIEKMKKDYAGQDIKYMIIIEGMSSRDNYSRNNELSYERALALYSLWKKNGIVFDNDICELQIAGSGINGVGRSRNEILNQRFLIQIVPKIGNIKEA